MKNPNIKILVACHKADPNIREDEIYMPIHVGKALNPDLDLGFQGDNTGDNISDKNPYYCELTALYWAWKNLKGLDYIGLVHYRRYFDFKNSSIRNKILTKNDIYKENQDSKFLIKELDKNKIIVPKEEVLPISVFNQFGSIHNILDLKKTYDIIKREFPEYSESFKNALLVNNKFSPFNMFIMSWENFNKYCDFLFNILFKLENIIDFKSYNKYQQRVFGFIAERLFNVYLDKINKKVIKYPIKVITEDLDVSLLHYMLNQIRYNISYNLGKPINYKHGDNL